MTAIPAIPSTQSNLQVETTDLLYLLRLLKGETKTEINCHTVGTIQTFDPITQTCTVNINYQKILKKRNALTPAPNSYTDVIIPYPTLTRVPIIVMGGGGSYTTYPIAKGDSCLILFCDRDIDGWLESGQITNPPFTGRLHDISDAVALVGLNPVTKPIPNYNTQIITMVDQTGQRLPPSGSMVVWPGTVLPSGWLFCQGQSLSTSQYPFIFAVIGYTYGGTGSNFNLPNMQGNVAVGLKSGDPSFGSLGTQVGEETHLLTGPESGIQAHTHPIPVNNSDGSPGDVGIRNSPTVGPYSSITGFTGPVNAQVPHNNIQPSLVINWIIKI